MKASSVSPSKAKVKEETQWQAGWWDFQPLSDPRPRPLEWSKSGIVFTGHPTQPQVIGRHLSSSKTFVLPPPPPIVNIPNSFEPPTIICLAPSDDHLFAYFPRPDGSGIACLWVRVARIDNWLLKNIWPFLGGAPIKVLWLGVGREWTYTQNGLIRLPPRGPQTPVSDITLLCILDNRIVHVMYTRNYETQFKVMRVSLDQPAFITEAQPGQVELPTVSASGVKRIVQIAVSLAYDENSMLIATRSHRYPRSAPAQTPTQFDNLSLNVPLDPPNDQVNHEWETWGEESLVDICELQLGFNGFIMNLRATPFPPFHVEGKISRLEFLCPHQGPHRPSSDTKKVYLTATLFDFKDYSSPPNSELRVIPFTRIPSNPTQPSWVSGRELRRSFTSEVLAFVVPSLQNEKSLFAVFLQSSGTLLKPVSKTKQIPTGSIKAINLSDLTDNMSVGPVPLLSHADKAGKHLPLNGAPSPNHSLFCTLSPSSPIQTTVHIVQDPKQTIIHNGAPRPVLSFALASAVLSRRTTADIVHILSAVSHPITEVIDTLYHAFVLLDSSHNGNPVILVTEMLGVIVDVYRGRERRTSDVKNKKYLREAWQAAHDICSLTASVMAFDDCQHGEIYDLDAAWQLIDLTAWILNFVEKLMKQCVISCVPEIKAGAEVTPSSKPVQLIAPLDSPTLLHLVHPFALMNLTSAIAHVRKLKNHIGSLNPPGEMQRIAKKALLDIVDSSGIHIEVLEPLMHECIKETMKLTVNDCRAALAACRPIASMHTHLSNVITKLTDSNVIDKPTLFLKPSELLDGVANISLTTPLPPPINNNGPLLMPGSDDNMVNRDVVTKGNFGKMPSFFCLRCGGRADFAYLSDDKLSIKWKTWARSWGSRCVCHGPWGGPTFQRD